MDIWVTFAFWQLWIISLWSWGFKYFFKSLPPVLLAMHPEGELLRYMEILFLIFGGNIRLFSILAAQFSIRINSAQAFQLLRIFPNNNYFLFLCFLTVAS